MRRLRGSLGSRSISGSRAARPSMRRKRSAATPPAASTRRAALARSDDRSQLPYGPAPTKGRESVCPVTTMPLRTAPMMSAMTFRMAAVRGRGTAEPSGNMSAPERSKIWMRSPSGVISNRRLPARSRSAAEASSRRRISDWMVSKRWRSIRSSWRTSRCAAASGSSDAGPRPRAPRRRDHDRRGESAPLGCAA